MHFFCPSDCLLLYGPDGAWDLNIIRPLWKCDQGASLPSCHAEEGLEMAWRGGKVSLIHQSHPQSWFASVTPHLYPQQLNEQKDARAVSGTLLFACESSRRCRLPHFPDERTFPGVAADLFMAVSSLDTKTLKRQSKPDLRKDRDTSGG